MQQKKTKLFLDVKSNKNIARAWESFTESGRLTPCVDVREVIQQSWFKSRSLGICPDVERAQTVITSDEIEEKTKAETLGRVGVSILGELADTLRDTQHVIVLADAKGQIFYSVGHRQVQDQLELINFRPGGSWSEEAVGSNGVGTPIALGRPEIVMGHEHYCRGWHPWVCYGAPIYDRAKREVLGSVDITGPVDSLNLEVMALAVSIANSIQSGLSILEYHCRELLRDIAKEKLQRWSSDGVVILDENGYIVEYNAAAIKYLQISHSHFSNKTVFQLLPALTEPVQCCYQTKKEAKVSIHFHGEYLLKSPVNVYIEPVMKGNKCLGVMLVILLPDSLTKAATKTGAPCALSHQAKYTFENIKGTSPAIEKTLQMAKVAAIDPLESNILLYGQTGTGKEILAHSVHAASRRKAEPFIAVNCAALPYDLVESELFGYVAGAFTGASRHGLKGKFESAHNGTLFLDEINSMSMALQAKLLRVLDSMEITRVGSAEPILVNVRVIAAANEMINTTVEEGSFREDLFHRLNVFEISIPKLSERGDDIIELANNFLQQQCPVVGRDNITLTPPVVEVMKRYHWPGNIRELNNICTRWVLTVGGNEVTIEDVPEKLKRTKPTVSSGSIGDIRSVNDELIKKTLIKTDNNISKAARILGIDRTTIYRRQRNW